MGFLTDLEIVRIGNERAHLMAGAAWLRAYPQRQGPDGPLVAALGTDPCILPRGFGFCIPRIFYQCQASHEPRW
jgi:hypothetical protein